MNIVLLGGLIAALPCVGAYFAGRLNWKHPDKRRELFISSLVLAALMAYCFRDVGNVFLWVFFVLAWTVGSGLSWLQGSGERAQESIQPRIPDYINHSN